MIWLMYVPNMVSLVGAGLTISESGFTLTNLSLCGWIILAGFWMHSSIRRW